MYLEKRTYVKNWEHMKPEVRTTVTVTRNGKAVSEIDPTKVKYIIEDAGYWRKANAIHAWFVEHVQDGVDDCGYYLVIDEQLQELLDTVNTILKASELVAGKVHVGTSYKGDEVIEHFEDGEIVSSPAVAQELLPTQSGFFFGSTDYDKYYIQDLKDTKDILEAALADKHGEYFYHSSW